MYEEEMRVEYQMAARGSAHNPITRKKEPRVPKDERHMRRAIASLLLLPPRPSSHPPHSSWLFFLGCLHASFGLFNLSTITREGIFNYIIRDKVRLSHKRKTFLYA